MCVQCPLAIWRWILFDVFPTCMHAHEDIDECGLPEGPCHEKAECNNTEGSYKCECNTGYEGDGYHCTG